MNKMDLIEVIAQENDISKAKAGSMVESFMHAVTAELKKGGYVTLSGFGSFDTYHRKARNGRNPQTGALIKVPGRRVARFTAGVELKKALNKK
jgi:DNA-binding protein HU-beta